MAEAQADTAVESSQKAGMEVLMEDYRAWLQELQKPDRWFADIVWLVLAGTAAAMAGVTQVRTIEPAAGMLLAAFIGMLFISINAEFLVTRVTSYRQISRHVAATRDALGVATILNLAPALREPGSPLLSSTPESFVRTAWTRRGRRSGFWNLYVVHRTALATIYLTLACAVPPPPTLLNSIGTTRWPWLLVLVVAAGHLALFSFVFRWRISEATSWGQFLITLARDRGVRVLPTAEQVLQQWLSQPSGDAAARDHPAVQVMIRYEDKRFFHLVHLGVDPVSALSVAMRRRRGGATTIPMQVARQLLRTTKSSGRWSLLKRKLFEAILGAYLVLRKGRTFVLRTWLNNVSFGRPDIKGLDQAASRYFGKTARDLDALDGLLLAERLTVWTGRYYMARIPRLAAWAVASGVLSASLAAEAQGRFDGMRARVPGDTRDDLPPQTR